MFFPLKILLDNWQKNQKISLFFILKIIFCGLGNQILNNDHTLFFIFFKSSKEIISNDHLMLFTHNKTKENCVAI
jgi:hypothetical protein